MSFAPTDLRLQLSAHERWIARLSCAKRVLSSFAVAALLFSSGGLLNWLVDHHFLPRISFILSGAIVSLVVGLLFWKMLSEVHDQHEVLAERIQRIGEVRHQVRNALQVITFTNARERSLEAIKQVNAAVARIESLLREQ